VEHLVPVRTRKPGWVLAVAAALALLLPSAVVTLGGTRPDLAQLPAGRFFAVAILWLFGFAGPLAAAILPRRGAVLVEPARASRWATVATGSMVLMCLLIDLRTPFDDAADRTHTLAQRLRLWWSCFGFSGQVALATLFVTTPLLLRSIEVGSWRIGAALGVAGGALAGLFLHLECRSGDLWHLVLGHAGGVVSGGLLGALVLPLAIRRLR
jgi:hypothetical protein